MIHPRYQKRDDLSTKSPRITPLDSLNSVDQAKKKSARLSISHTPPINSFVQMNAPSNNYRIHSQALIVFLPPLDISTNGLCTVSHSTSECSISLLPSSKQRKFLKLQIPGGHSNGKRGYQAHPWTHQKHPNHIFFKYGNRP